MNLPQLTTFDYLLVALIIGLVLLIVRLIFMVRSLNGSFAKLSYFTREDAKKYFDTAADKAVGMNEEFLEQNQHIVEAGMKQVIIDTGTVMEKSIADAQAEAADIVLKARQDADRIIQEAKEHSSQYYVQALDRSVAAMEWAMEQYIKQHVSLQEHEQIINTLIKEYLDEQ